MIHIYIYILFNCIYVSHKDDSIKDISVLQYMNNSGVNVGSLTNDTTEYMKVMDKLNETNFLSVYPEFEEYWQ